MAGANRTTGADLEARLTTAARRYDFYQLVEFLQQHYQDADNTADLEEVVQLRSTASIGFPASDVVSLERLADARWKLTTTFMGLHGSPSPLPGYYLDNLAWEEAQQEERLTDFLNLFNHRLLSLLHKIWRKYRYYICFKDDGQDEFSRRMFALVGLEAPALRNQLRINHSRMLAYAGLLASPARSPDVICSLVAHCFDLEDVTLDSWQLRFVTIEPEQQTQIGRIRRRNGQRAQGRSVLGENFTLGARVRDYSGKFRLNINGLSRQHFMDFLPNGENYGPLTTFVSFILRDQFAWDLRLGIATQQVDGMTLGKVENSQLGWTSFIGQPDSEPEVVICFRE